MSDVELTPEQELEAAIRSDLGLSPAAPPAAEAQPEIEVKAEAASPPSPTVPPATATPFEETIVWRGQERKITDRDEARELIQKGYDYTQKTMEVAERQRQLETLARELQDRENRRQTDLRTFLSDPDQVRAYYEALVASKGGAARVSAPQQADPFSAVATDEDEFISKTEARKLVTEAVEAARAEARKVSSTAIEESQIEQQKNVYRNDFDAHMLSLVREKYPLVGEFAGPEVLTAIRAEAQKFLRAQMTLNPGVPVDPAQVKNVMADAVRRRSELYESKLREREKVVALQRTQLVQSSPEPKGGTAPPAPSSKPLKLNDAELDRQVLAEIQSIMGR